jgi:hypothetical protein
MTSTVPGVIAWPAILFMAIVVVVRYFGFNTNRYDGYLNNTLAILLVAQLLREHVVQKLLSDGALISATTAQQVSTAVMIFASAEFIGLTMLWSGLSVPEARRRHRYYRCAATLLAIAFLITGTSARVAGQSLDVSGGWQRLLGCAFYSTMHLVLVIQVLRIGVKELAGSGTPRRERLVAGGGVALAVAIGLVTLESLLLVLFQQLGWLHTTAYRVRVHGVYFFWEAFGFTVIAAIPCVLAVAARGGLDRVSRQWRKLQPLQHSMRKAVPENAFGLQHDDGRRRKTTLQLHQTTVGVRDLILQLRPYFRDITPQQADQFVMAHSVPPAERAAATLALQLAWAAQAKTLGATPQRPDAARITTSRATTLEQETGELMQLAKWWPHAAAATQSPTTATSQPFPRTSRASTAGAG